MNKTRFVYTVYIATTPEQVWKALVQGDVTLQYWEHENISDWKPGSTWEHRTADASRELKLVGRVIESSPPRRLVISWAAPADAARPERHTRVTFEVEPIEDMVQLTVTHDEIDEGSETYRQISEGWPRVLSSMKSFLETGRPLRTWAKARAKAGA